MLTFDEVPDNVNVFTRDIHIIKSDIVSGYAVQQFGNTSFVLKPLECERIAQQQRRQNKRKLENTLELNGQKKRCKIAEEKSQEMVPCAVYDKKDMTV